MTNLIPSIEYGFQWLGIMQNHIDHTFEMDMGRKMWGKYNAKFQKNFKVAKFPDG